jgi:hypothetical protein
MMTGRTRPASDHATPSTWRLRSTRVPQFQRSLTSHQWSGGLDAAQCQDETQHCVSATPHATASLNGLYDWTHSASIKCSIQSPLVTLFHLHFFCRVDPFQLLLLLVCKCANTTKCTPSYASVLEFYKHFSKGVSHSTCHVLVEIKCN